MLAKTNRYRRASRAALAFLLPLVAAGCDDVLNPSGTRSTGVAARVESGGPRVVWDPVAVPLPEIPLPNDAATRRDPTSPTGRRLNISLQATTRLESQIRGRFNRLDGFGVFSPIYVRFDAPLDLDAIDARHNTNDDFRDDAVFLLNVDPSCSRFGEEIALDLGRGRYPVTLFKRATRVPDVNAPNGYRIDDSRNTLFRLDPNAESYNLVFRDMTEDRNGDGVLQPWEDLNGNGRIDRGNFRDPDVCDGLEDDPIARDRCIADHLLTWYERDTDTLILRPVWPLEERCTHAVVLTKRVVGVDGRPVESPFPGVNPRDQTQALAPLSSLLPRYGLGLGDVAFAWTFTTGTVTHDLLAVRAGLYGHGPFAELGAAIPDNALRFWPLAELEGEETEANAGRIAYENSCGGIALSIVYDLGYGEWDPNMCASFVDMVAIERLVGGTFAAPNLLVDKDGRAGTYYADDFDETFDLDTESGRIVYGQTEPTFWCALPYAYDDVTCEPGNPGGVPFCRPFPMILYAHGYGSSRGELLNHMGRHAAMGYASCSLDSYGHGFTRLLDDPEVARGYALLAPLLRRWNAPGMLRLIAQGRDRDLTNNGLSDPGGDMWTADVFHTRDMVRQSVVEYMQFVRMLRGCDGARRAQDGRVLCDVTGDGLPDFGGADAVLSMWGISLGGIIAGVLAGAEPALDAVSPNAGGAGLTDITVRSNQGGLPEAVLLPITGPVFVGCLPVDGSQNPLAPGTSTEADCFGQGIGGTFEGGTLRFGTYLNVASRSQFAEVGAVAGVEVGDRVVIENLVLGRQQTAYVNPHGWVRVAVAADALNLGEKRAAVGLPDALRDDEGQPFAPFDVSDTRTVGDALRITVYAGSTDTVRGVIDSFANDVVYLNLRYAAGQPLVALMSGFGYGRNTPDFRRFVGIASTAVSPADPAAWSAYYHLAPPTFDYPSYQRPGGPRVLLMPTAGDQVVPVNTGVAHGRVAGHFGSWLRDESVPAEYGWRELFRPDPRYGVSIDQALIDTFQIEADPRLQRFASNPVHANVVHDIDNLSDGAARFTCGPSDWSGLIGENGCPPELVGEEILFPVPTPVPGAELRATVPRGDGTFDAFRIPLVRPAGQHGIYNAQPHRVFDMDAWAVNYTSRFLGTAGRRAVDVPGCDCTADGVPRVLRDGRAVPMQTLGSWQPCDGEKMRICDAACNEAWGFRLPVEVDCR
jgi:hypothetical protein